MGREFEGQGQNPEKKEQRDRKLRKVFALGQSLAASPDQTTPVFPEQEEGPKIRHITLHADSLDAAGLGGEFFHGEVTVSDAFTDPEEEQDYYKSVEVSLKKIDESEGTTGISLKGIEDLSSELKAERLFNTPSDDIGTVITTRNLYINDPEIEAPIAEHSTLEREYAEWPLIDTSEYTDFGGHSVMPRFAQKPESKLSGPSSKDVSEEGWDMIAKALKEEARIREIQIEEENGSTS
jgi:hypothetical protein